MGIHHRIGAIKITLDSLNTQQMRTSGWEFQNTYQELPPILFEPTRPKQYRAPKALLLNESLAAKLGIDVGWFNTIDAVDVLSGNRLPEASKPIAQAYAGHQFGNFTILGDGRAILLGEHRTPTNQLVDIQLKGSGPTPYSRRGDGLATLNSMLKEYIFGESMHALGIPTSRCLSIIETGESVFRERPYRGAVLTRVASSHIRIGTFEFAHLHSADTVKALADYAIQRHDPDLINEECRYLQFLERVIDRQARLVAQWMSVGFVHGVMNTDNVSIAGETIDYGPCAFIDEYDPQAVFSSIDRQGRYAYGNQPRIIHWNLCRFAETLLPLINPENINEAIQQAETVLEKFPNLYQMYWQQFFAKKIGFDYVSEETNALVDQFLKIMQSERLDFTSTFDQLSTGTLSAPAFNPWIRNWETELSNKNLTAGMAQRQMRCVNPVITVRNHILESVIDEVGETGQMDSFQDLLVALRQPYSETNRVHGLYPPKPFEIPRTVTYCGT